MRQLYQDRRVTAVNTADDSRPQGVDAIRRAVSASRHPTSMHVRLIGTGGSSGMTDASATMRFSNPRTSPSAVVTASGSSGGPIRQVPAACS